MAKHEKRQGKIDITVQNERGSRQRFVAESVEDVRVRIYSYCRNLWAAKGPRLQSVLGAELSGRLEKTFKEDDFSFSISGLTIIPTLSFASN